MLRVVVFQTFVTVAGVVAVAAMLRRLKHHLDQEFFFMSETLNTKITALEGKVDELSTKLDSAAQRDAVQSETLTAVKAELQALKDQVVTPLPVDTSAAEQRLDALISKITDAETKVDALDAAPNQSAPTNPGTGAPTGTETQI